MPSILRLGDLVPERRPIELNRVFEVRDGPDGELTYVTKPIVLQAFAYGERCPVTVKAALAQVRDKFRQDAKDNNGIVTDEMFQEYARDSFIHLIPGISFEEADLLASDDNTQTGRCVKVLQYLNYWITSSSDEEEEPDPNLKGEEKLITQESSPISN